MPVNILNLPGLDVVDFRETATEYHVRAKPKAVSRQCPSCGPAGKVVIHEHKTLCVRDMPSHGKSMAIYLDVPRFKCHDCVKTFTAVVPEVDADRQIRVASTDGNHATETDSLTGRVYGSRTARSIKACCAFRHNRVDCQSACNRTDTPYRFSRR